MNHCRPEPVQIATVAKTVGEQRQLFFRQRHVATANEVFHDLPNLARNTSPGAPARQRRPTLVEMLVATSPIHELQTGARMSNPEDARRRQCVSLDIIGVRCPLAPSFWSSWPITFAQYGRVAKGTVGLFRLQCVMSAEYLDERSGVDRRIALPAQNLLRGDDQPFVPLNERAVAVESQPFRLGAEGIRQGRLSSWHIIDPRLAY